MANNVGATTFPAVANEAYTAVETLAVQEIRSLKSTNRLYDAVFDWDVSNGTVVETAVVQMAQKQTFNRDKAAWDVLDPSVAVRYYNNFETSQYYVSIRDLDIRAIIAGTGVATVESVTGEILDTLTQGEGADDFAACRSLLLGSTAYDYSTKLGGVPADMDGVLYAIRDMYNAIRYDNTEYTATGWKSSTPEADIRIAISDKLLNLIDVTALANIFNLEKVELFGKIVVIPTSDLETSAANTWTVVAYDRKRFNRATRLYEYMQSPKLPGQLVTSYLTVVRAYFESELFKAAKLDVSAAATAKLASIITAG